MLKSLSKFTNEKSLTDLTRTTQDERMAFFPITPFNQFF